MYAMPMRRSLHLGPRLAAVSGFSIECFLSAGVFSIPFSKSAAEICFTIVIVLWLLRKFPWDEPFPRLGIPNRAYAVYFLAVALSLFTAPRELLGTGLRGCLKWAEYLLLFFLCAQTLREPGRRRRLLTVFLGSAALIALNGFYQMVTGADLIKGYTVDIPGRFVRMRSSLPSPNDLGAFLLLAVPLAFSSWLGCGRWNRRSALRVAALTLTTTAFIGTLSRAAFFSLLLAAAAYTALTQKKRYVLAGGGAVALLFLASGTLRQNFLYSINMQDITIGERFRTWHTTFKMIAQHPLIGNGVNMFYQKFPSFAAADESYRGYAHNGYLQIWAETGILGLAAFLVPVAAALGRGFRSAAAGRFETRDALLVGLSAFLIQSFFDTNLHAMQTSLVFWVLWGAFHAALTDGGIHGPHQPHRE